ncbi:MAG TPA: beta-ketoacyl-[acyl-carrier-protein] synthase II [Treponema sp.]|nr:beta-ketoacyl-[acyl-carrier-protein] synthase II [Treponema sp.]
MQRRRVVITGMGAVTPIGNSPEAAWESAKKGVSGAGPITLFDTSDYPVTIAAEVKNLTPEDYGVEHRALRKMARFTQFLLCASAQAIKDSGYTKESLSQEKNGIVVGACMGGLDAYEEGYKKFFDPQSGVSRIPPLTMPLAISNEAAANVSMYFDLHGPALTIGTACASGSDAIGQAVDLIRGGRIDVCLTGGTEASITGFGVGSYATLQALSTHYNDTPQKASRPFDKDRDGFVMGEGSAVFIIEELEHAKKRGAKIYAEIAGYGSSSDAFHITAPRKDGEIAKLAIEEALRDANLKAEDIQYYNAHGTSTRANDICETKVLKMVFGDYAKKLHISSTKSMTGHMIGAAGAIEALFCVKAINDSFIPPTINLDNPDIENGCDLDYTPNVGISLPITATASCSLGFGGHNACLVITKYIG